MIVPTPVYLDNHATTRCDPAVVEALLPYLSEEYGNAGSRSHDLGMRARTAVEGARASVAALLSCSPKEIVWTSGATEANNLAILGAARARQARGRHVITVATEHKAVLDPVAALQQEGFEATVLPVGPTGEIDVEDLRGALRPDTTLVSVMAVNNEIGALQPLEAVGALCRDRGVLLHCDAAQAPTVMPLDLQRLPVDLLSLSAHKMYGPKGIGALYVRRTRPRVELQPLMYGGGQERGLRSGTLPVALCVGMGVAARLAAEGLAAGEPQRLAALRDRLYHGLRDALPDVHLNGPPLSRRAAHNLNVSFEGAEAEALIVGLRDVAVSTGSACTSASLEPSHVLRALGLPRDRAHASIRFGLGRFTDAAQIDYVIERVVHQVRELRALSALYEPDVDPPGGE